MTQGKRSVLSLRVAPLRKALYRAAAASEGMRISEWLRYVADMWIAERGRRPSVGGKEASRDN
jgi:hypothetical protein